MNTFLKQKKLYPKTIYKYIYLDNITPSEQTKFHSYSQQSEIENCLYKASNFNNNEKKLFSLSQNTLWFSRSNNPCLNDPFEGKRIIYDDVVAPFNKTQIEYWQQYADEIRNRLFLCCFSKQKDSPAMWANYANNYKGYCLEFEIIDTQNLWEVDYSYGKNLPNFEIEGLQKDLWEDRITKNQAYEYIEKLHIHWATSKHGDWKYEREIRALFTNLTDEMNLAYEKIGIKLSGIIIGHNCASEHRKFLSYIAKKTVHPH